MEYGIFTVGDVTTDPTTGRTPTEHERIKNTVAIALKAEATVKMSPTWRVRRDLDSVTVHDEPPTFQRTTRFLCLPSSVDPREPKR